MRTAAYSYDALDRRMARSGSGANVTPQRFLSAGDEEIAELGPTGSTITRRFVPGSGTDQPVATVAANGAVSYFHADRLGSIVALSSATGALQERYTYSPFGVETAATGQSQPFRYAARRVDPETGLYHNRARAYDPRLGRFLQTDPILFQDQMNLYAYVANDPVNATDPSGLEGVGCWNDGSGCGSAQGIGARAAVVGIRSEQVRNAYNEGVSKLSPGQTDARSALKADARAQTPPEVRAGIEAQRPSTDPSAGTGGTANRKNPAANKAAGSLGALGKASAGLTVLTAGADIATSSDPARAVASNTGAIAGGIAGGKVGAEIGLLGGPYAPVTSPAGAIIGAAIGGYAGYEAGGKVYDNAPATASTPKGYDVCRVRPGAC